MKKAIAFGLILILAMTGCQSPAKKEVVIAEQYGLAYAPIQIAKTLGLFEKHMPEGVTVSYAKLANTTAIREAMLSGDLDVGFMGIPPFLIGRDKGMDWNVMMGLSQSPLGLVVHSEDVTSIEQLQGQGKIALPQPGSIQHILLTMYAKDRLGSADVFDEQLVSMKHPDGYQALMNDPEVVAHFTSPPYLFQEMDEAQTVLMVDGQDAMGGPFTFIVGVCREDFLQESQAYQAVVDALKEAITYIEENRSETIDILSQSYELDTTTVEAYIYNRGMLYDKQIIGVQKFVDFMYEEGYLENHVKEVEVIW